MTAADELTALVNNILANLPEGANPWAAIRAAFTAQVRPDFGNTFLGQLYACSALIALETVALAACMFLKWRQGTYWLFRIRRATGGTYIVPHYSSNWTTFIVLFFSVLQGYLWKTIYFSRGDLVYDSALWRTSVWWAGWIAFYLAAWSLCVSHVLHLDSSGRPARSFVAQAPFMNTFGILLICGSAVSIGLLASAAHKKYHSAMTHYRDINNALYALELSYTGTFDVSLFQSGIGFSIAEHFVTDLASFGTYFRWTFIAYLIWTILLEMVLVIAGVLHLRELRATMDELAIRTSMSEEARSQEKLIEQTYTSLVHVTWAVCILLTAVNVMFAFVSASGSKVVYVKVYAQTASLLPPWIFAVLGLPLSLLFLRRTYLASKHEAGSPSASIEKGATASTRPPLVDADTGLTSILSSSGMKPTGGAHDAYPMTELTYPHPVDGPHAPSSPQSTIESAPTHGGGGPGSIGTVTSDSRLFVPSSTPTTASTGQVGQDQPFYSSYATRTPLEVEEMSGNGSGHSSWNLRARRG
ncbi:hypothetical protein JCM10212_003834 [Sporobolomyces blumeae]